MVECLEIIDIQIAYYRSELERIVLMLQGRKDNISELTEEATRYAHYISALDGVKFLTEQMNKDRGGDIGKISGND
jgi:hypothetical protein